MRKPKLWDRVVFITATGNRLPALVVAVASTDNPNLIVFGDHGDVWAAYDVKHSPDAGKPTWDWLPWEEEAHTPLGAEMLAGMEEQLAALGGGQNEKAKRTCLLVVANAMVVALKDPRCDGYRKQFLRRLSQGLPGLACAYDLLAEEG